MTTNRSKPKDGHVPLSIMLRSAIKPSPENDDLYGPVDADDLEIVELTKSIRRHGLREPIVVTLDGFILSGHRRYVASRRAGMIELPVRVERINRTDDIDAFVVLLREYNRQRDKSIDQKIREEIVTANPEESHRLLVEHRSKAAEVTTEKIWLRHAVHRKSISSAKWPLLKAIQQVIKDQEDFWPLSARRVHYALLNDPPLIHASKPDSTYQNDLKSYKAMVELATRARLTGEIDMDSIDDETRPLRTWDVWDDPRGYIRSELDTLFKGYYRNLQRSQPNHIEIVVEKNTVEPIVRPVAAHYCIPIGSARGYASIPPRAKIANRFIKSGKQRLVLLIASDFDPDGEEIAHSLARSMRDDFGVQIDAVKVALTEDQVSRFNLPPRLKAKQSSSRYQRFANRFGDDVFELEAIPPATLQQLFHEAIDGVMDIDLFNAEVDAEKADSAHLDEKRRQVHAALKMMSN